MATSSFPFSFLRSYKTSSDIKGTPLNRIEKKTSSSHLGPTE